MYQLVEFITKKPVSTEDLIFTGEETPWEIFLDMEAIKKKISPQEFKTSPAKLSKYLPFFPLKQPNSLIALQETPTPLVSSKHLIKLFNLKDLLFKLEGKNITGSFKDRGSMIDVTVAKKLGAKAIILASTGNMAASCACYSAVAEIPCFILIPENIPQQKLIQAISFGGNIVRISGTFNDAEKLAKTIAKEMHFYLAGDYAFRAEGQKTAAFEIMDQLSFEVPDIIILPIGCGTNIASYAKAFKEYQTLGLIERIPQLIGVQADGANAVVRSYNEKKTTITPLKTADTIANAIAVPNPIDGIKALDAIYSTGGMAISVSDEEMLEAQYLLSSKEGLFVETSSATTIAALKKISPEKIFCNKKVICILTGDGLKDTRFVLKRARKPPIIFPEKKEFLKLYKKIS